MSAEIDRRWTELLASLRKDAEQRLGVAGTGDQSACMDPAYGAALDAWDVWLARRAERGAR